MKIVRQLLRKRILKKIPVISKIDRYNRQYENLEEEEAADYESGVIFIEILPTTWEHLAGNIQEADATIRLHVCRTFYGDSSSIEDVTEPLDILDLPVEVYRKLNKFTMVDSEGRTIARSLVRTGSTEDNNHQGLEVDIIDFSTRLTDYSAQRTRRKVIANPVLEDVDKTTP